MKQKVFGIGLPRTGTGSLSRALRSLGYKSIHNPDAFRKTQHEGSFTFDGEWDALVNFGEHTYPQLDATYPGSKFVLTVRDKEPWLKSLQWLTEYKSLGEMANRTLVEIFGFYRFNEQRASYVYDKHIAEVTEYFRERPDDLLVVDWSDGNEWDRLCGFLEHPVPEADFPHNNRRGTDVYMKLKRKGRKVLSLWTTR